VIYACIAAVFGFVCGVIATEECHRLEKKENSKRKDAKYED
jgi:hypothetical protein